MEEPYCTVSGGNEDEIALSVWTVPGTGTFELYLLGSRGRIPAAKSYSMVPVLLTEREAPINGQVVDYSTSAKRVLRISLNAPGSVGPMLARAKNLSFNFEGKALTVPVPGMSAAMKALEECVDDSLPEWGVDPTAYRSLRALPNFNSKESWITYRDYPEEAMIAMTNGLVVARLTTDITGRVIDCAVVRSSGTKSIDKVTCEKAIERGRYTPAVGADGKPVQASFIRTAVFTISDHPPN